jgi:Lrp/AsnC family leucine-responsive transcriptional regulator
MKFGKHPKELDAISIRLLDALQRDCKTPLAVLGERVGLSAPSVVERIRKLEDAGIITGYVALLDGRKLGKDVTAFIGVSTQKGALVDEVGTALDAIEHVLEVHDVTGPYTFMLKVKTDNTATLKELIQRLVAIEGVTSTETMIVLSTHAERWYIPLGTADVPQPRRLHRGHAQPGPSEPSGDEPPARRTPGRRRSIPSLRRSS